MQLNLDRLDAGGVDLAWGGEAAERRISLGLAKGLRGHLSRTDAGLQLSNLAAQSLIVSLLRLKFETFFVALEAEGGLSNLSGDYERRAEGTDLHLVSGSLRAPDLSFDFGTFRVRGDLNATNVEVHYSKSRGRVRAESLRVERLRIAGVVALEAESLLAEQIDVSWGPGSYGVRVGELGIPKARCELELGSPTGAPRGAPDDTASTSSAPVVDWNLLDGLSGDIDVDLFVDVRVPVLGTRQATHPFRIAIRDGSIDYREVERNLATLEDAFLDFSVRENALVLERGIPLLPTRGRGKPLVFWPLSPSDLELSSQNRVRLAVLPHAQRAVADESNGPETEHSNVALKELGFIDLDATLRLEQHPASTGPVRALAFEELRVQGTVQHLPEDDPPSGELTGQLSGLSLQLAQLPLGTSRLELGKLRVGALTDVRASFLGLRPQRVGFELGNLDLADLSMSRRGSVD